MLTKTITHLEELLKTRNELVEWIKQQIAFVSEWNLKPLKLRNDANSTDFSIIQRIIPLIEIKVEEINDSELQEKNELLIQLNSFEKLVSFILFFIFELLFQFNYCN